MRVVIPFIAVFILFLLAYFGVESAGLHTLFGVVIPYIAIVLFIVGIIYKIVRWAVVPVPFRIPTTCGQQKSLPWIKESKLDNPSSTLGVIGRMALEILFFRSLFRNTRTEIRKDGPKVAYGSNKWLWLGGMVFHWTMLIILLRHLRFFTEPVPWAINVLQNVDGFFQIGVPVFYATTILFLLAAGWLFLRRVVSPQLRYISLANDYFPLFLLLGIGCTGFLMRHLMKTDIVAVKKLTLGLISFNPVATTEASGMFYAHFFLVCVLFAYFPFSKLTHMAGVFLSPTRNLANNNRMVRHVNPWDYPVKVHTYEEYEEEFEEKMKKAGIPLDKE
jgi:nitrate reductase gamma subunit